MREQSFGSGFNLTVLKTRNLPCPFFLFYFRQGFILHIQSCCKQGLLVTIEASIPLDGKASAYYNGNTNMIALTKRGLDRNKEKIES